MTGRHDNVGRCNDLAQEPVEKSGEHLRRPLEPPTRQITEARPIDGADPELGREPIEERASNAGTHAGPLVRPPRPSG